MLRQQMDLQIKERINAFECFQLFLTHVDKIYGFKVTTLRTYMEYEWSTIKLRDFLEKQGINHQYAASGHEQDELEMNKSICGKRMSQDTTMENFIKGGIGPTI